MQERVIMEERASYGQFCPVAMAAEVFCCRWTVLVIRELLCGTTRFNDLRRGLPRMSPTLLTKRLRELVDAGIVRTVPATQRNAVEYRLTPAGEELRPIVMSLGRWGQRWIEAQPTLRKLDASLLMWDMRRRLHPDPLPPRRCTLHFHYPELPQATGNWWLVIDGGKVDLCSFDPGHDIDLEIRTSLRTMTAIWTGISSVRKEVASGALELEGDNRLARSMEKWLGLSAFAGEKKQVAA
jgi:DNA-binding HxlR family transcriptional regulator